VKENIERKSLGMEIIDLSLTCKKVDQQKELHGAGKWSRPIVTLSCLQMKSLWAGKISATPSILPGCTLTVSPCEYHHIRDQSDQYVVQRLSLSKNHPYSLKDIYLSTSSLIGTATDIK
jgi:hypothetical protein